MEELKQKLNEKMKEVEYFAKRVSLGITVGLRATPQAEIHLVRPVIEGVAAMSDKLSPEAQPSSATTTTTTTDTATPTTTTTSSATTTPTTTSTSSVALVIITMHPPLVTTTVTPPFVVS